MIGFKKNNTVEESTETTPERPEVRQRVRHRTTSRTEVKTEEPMGFSFGMIQDDEDDEYKAPVKKESDSVTEEPDGMAEEHVGVAEEPDNAVEEHVSVAEEPEIIKEPEIAEIPVKTPASVEPVVDEVTEKHRSDAQKSLDRILSGGAKTKRDSLLRRVQNTVAIYNSRNSGVTSEDVQIRYYHDEMNEVMTTEDGRLIFPNQRIYYRGFTEEWDRVNEVRVPNGAEFELDLGIGIFLPDGYELELAGVRELRTKYELELIDGVIHLSRQNAMFPIVVQMRAIGDMAYVQKHKSLIQARLVRV